MSKLKKGILSLAFAFIFLIGCNKVYAAQTGLSASSYSVSPGTNVTITASVSATEAYSLKMTASGGSLTGNTNSADAFGSERNATVLSGTFNSNTPGKYTITLSGSVTGSDLVKQNVSKSITITVNQPSTGNNGGTTNPNTGSNGNQGGSTSSGNQGGNTNTPSKDSNANLKNLGINPNDFRGFQSGKTEYSVNVPNNVTSINVYATASSSKAKVSGTGNKSLKEGTNKFSVTVIAEAGNTKTYTISVNREAENGQDVPNVIDEQPNEEQPSVGVGLESLIIEGFELDKEFKTDVYEYIVKTEEDLSLEDLESLKEKITANTNSDKVSKEIIAEISEDGKKTITIIVKDDQKEYSRYVITFEKEEEEKEPVVGLMTDNSNPQEPKKGVFGLSPEKQVYVLLACFGITFLMAVYFACIAYIKSKRLAEYEENEYEEEDHSEFEKMNEYYVGVEGGVQQNNAEELGKEEFSEDTVSEVTSALGKLNGYRSMRNGSKSSGRHF